MACADIGTLKKHTSEEAGRRKLDAFSCGRQISQLQSKSIAVMSALMDQACSRNGRWIQY